MYVSQSSNYRQVSLMNQVNIQENTPESYSII